jgi:gamma-polyglutamate synthase
MLIVHVVTVGLLIGLLALAAEAAILAVARLRVPIRILVTGTRGKSSVVRLIHHALIQNHVVATGKTTGSAARLLSPEGDEKPVRRRGRVSILEQRRVLIRAAQCSSKALVIEAMAIDPEVAEAEARRILKPTHVVVTNARVDHLGPAGSDVKSVAEVLACSVPKNARMYVPEGEMEGDVGPVLRATKAKIMAVPFPEEILLEGNSPSPVFGGNVALASCLCEDLGISPAAVLDAALNAPPDPGAFCIYQSRSTNTAIINAFAANDPVSSRTILRVSHARHPELQTRDLTIVLTVREDRADRTKLWLDDFRQPSWNASSFIILGDRGQSSAAARLLRKHIHVPIHLPRFRRISDLSDFLVSAQQEGVLLCVGNLAGIGGQLVEYWDRECSSYG